MRLKIEMQKKRVGKDQGDDVIDSRDAIRKTYTM